MKKYYCLKKDSIELKAGAIVEFKAIHLPFIKTAGYYAMNNKDVNFEIFYPKDVVENSPEWFKEVYKFGDKFISKPVGYRLVNVGSEPIIISHEDDGNGLRRANNRFCSNYKSQRGELKLIGAFPYALNDQQIKIVMDLMDEKISSKPPLGIMPRFIWIEKRLAELHSAITRYVLKNAPIPKEWIEEQEKLEKEQDEFEASTDKILTGNAYIDNLFKDGIDSSKFIIHHPGRGYSKSFLYDDLYKSLLEINKKYNCVGVMEQGWTEEKVKAFNNYVPDNWEKAKSNILSKLTEAYDKLNKDLPDQQMKEKVEELTRTYEKSMKDLNPGYIRKSEDTNQNISGSVKDYEILSFYHVPTKDLEFIVISSNSTYWNAAISGNSNFAIHSVKRLSDGEVFTIGDKIIGASFSIPRKIEKIGIDDNNELFFEQRHGSCKLKDLKKGKHSLEKDYEILSYIHKDVEIVKTADCLKRHPAISEDYNIYSVKRISDGEIFNVGDRIHYKESDSLPKAITEFLIQENDNRLRVICGNYYNIFLNNVIQVELKKKKVLFVTEDKVNISEGDDVWFMRVPGGTSPCMDEMFVPEKFNWTTYERPAIESDNYKWFSTEEAAKTYANKVIESQKEGSLRKCFITEEGEAAFDGETVYGIATQASGDDVWRAVKLPFAEYQKGNSRVWFKSQEKANEYLILNYPCLSITDLAKMWDYGMKKEDLTLLVKSKIGNRGPGIK